MDRLEGAQIEALQRLQSVLGPHDTDFVIAVLESVAWDVQVSIVRIVLVLPRATIPHHPAHRKPQTYYLTMKIRPRIVPLQRQNRTPQASPL